jgi:hypothetical protein
MGPKLQDLCIKLKTAGEYETADKANSSGMKLSAFLDNYSRFQRSGAQSGGQSNPSLGFQQPQKSQGGFFEDFNNVGNQGQGGQTASFDNFNQFSQTSTAPTQPKPSTGGDFWSEAVGGSKGNQGATSQPVQNKQPGGSFFDTHFEAGPSNPNTSTPNGQSQRPTGQGFFDDHFGGGSQPQTPPQQNKLDEVNLLGVDASTGQKAQNGGQRQGTQASSNQANIDLLSLGANPPVAQQVPPQNFAQNNPFGAQAAMQGFGAMPAHQGGFHHQHGMAPTTFPGSFGHPHQMGLPQGHNFGAQNPGLTPLMYQHMMANHQPLGFGNPVYPQAGGFAGGNPAPSFGASNNIAFAQDGLKMASDKRKDPFSDLTTDLV